VDDAADLQAANHRRSRRASLKLKPLFGGASFLAVEPDDQKPRFFVPHVRLPPLVGRKPGEFYQPFSCGHGKWRSIMVWVLDIVMACDGGEYSNGLLGDHVSQPVGSSLLYDALRVGQ